MQHFKVCYSCTQKFFTIPLDPQQHLCWMKHIGINAKVASHVFSLLASVEGTTVCLEIPLQSPPPPPPGDRHLATVCPPTRETVAR